MGKKLTLYTDGASKGNPGMAGIGVVIKGTNGEVVRKLSKFIGYTTNNVAEYWALIFALKEALKEGAQEVVCRTDSQLMERQWNGLYRVRNKKLKGLYERAKTLAQGFHRFAMEHIPREENEEADRLANDSIKEHRSKSSHRAQPKKAKGEESPGSAGQGAG